MKFSRGKRR